MLNDKHWNFDLKPCRCPAGIATLTEHQRLHDVICILYLALPDQERILAHVLAQGRQSKLRCQKRGLLTSYKLTMRNLAVSSSVAPKMWWSLTLSAAADSAGSKASVSATNIKASQRDWRDQKGNSTCSFLLQVLDYLIV